MRVLGIDTALGACSAAVCDDTGVRARAHQDMPRGHAEALAPMVESVMREADLPFSALDRIAVTTGPGTFTGQRVGLAFARSMALALNIPAVGVTTLEAMAAEALAGTDAAWAAAISDARRDEVYLGILDRDGIEIIPPCVLAVSEAASLIARSVAGRGVLAGTGAALIAPRLEALGVEAHTTSVLQPDACMVARLAMDREAKDHPPHPLYLRPPDAKLPSR